jgi:hypothetical protein
MTQFNQTNPLKTRVTILGTVVENTYQAKTSQRTGNEYWTGFIAVEVKDKQGHANRVRVEPFTFNQEERSKFANIQEGERKLFLGSLKSNYYENANGEVIEGLVYQVGKSFTPRESETEDKARIEIDAAIGSKIPNIEQDFIATDALTQNAYTKKDGTFVNDVIKLKFRAYGKFADYVDEEFEAGDIVHLNVDIKNWVEEVENEDSEAVVDDLFTEAETKSTKKIYHNYLEIAPVTPRKLEEDVNPQWISVEQVVALGKAREEAKKAELNRQAEYKANKPAPAPASVKDESPFADTTVSDDELPF